MVSRAHFAIVIRNIVFGVEDSLVSTVGFLSGIASTGMEVSNVILTGTILLFVEAFSMAAGSLISELSAEEYEAQKEVPMKDSLQGSAIMFFSYIFAGFLILLPYILIPIKQAFPLSILISFVMLWLLGLLSARRFGINPLKNSLKTVIIGGIAIVVGITVGKLLG